MRIGQSTATTVITASLLLITPHTGKAQSLDTNGPYCVGASMSACKAALARDFVIVTGNIDAASMSWGRTDISGNHIHGVGTLSLILRPKARERIKGLVSVTLHMGPDGKIDNLDLTMSRNPAAANTFDEYNRTNLYDAAAIVLPRAGCAELDKALFYRFFNDKIKPTIGGGDRSQYSSPGSATDEEQYWSKEVAICGVYMDYRRDVGVSTTFMDNSNPSGRYDNVTVNMWRN